MQGKIHKSIDKFYLENFSKQISRERKLKSKYQKNWDEDNIASPDFAEFVDLLKVSSSDFTNKVKSLSADNIYKLTTSFKTQGYPVGDANIEQLTMKALVDASEGKFDVNDFLARADVLNVPREKIDKTGIAESKTAKSKKRKKIYKEDDLFDTASDDETPLDIEEPIADPIEGDEELETKDAFEEADEILAEVDIAGISNGVRLALIEAIVDSAQNAVDSEEANDEAFNDFMLSLQEIIDGFRYDDEEAEELDPEDFADDLDEPTDEPAEEPEGDLGIEPEGDDEDL